jgi:hypothetical protein
MSNVSGKNLLGSLLYLKDIGLLQSQQQDLENALQEVLDAGQGSAFALADILRVNPLITESLEQGENLAVIVNTSVQEIENLIPVDVDTEPFPDPAVFDAQDNPYEFVDHAAAASNVIINNFSTNDIITFVNADPSDYTFANDGEDVMLTNNYNDEGIMNIITLTGVVDVDELVYDLDSFSAATGFNPFVV